jgi:hypothetical protein
MTSLGLAALDHTGAILRAALGDAGALPPGFATPRPPASATMQRSVSTPLGVSLARLDERDKNPGGSSPSPEADEDVGLQRSSSMPGTTQAEQQPQVSSIGLGLGSLLARMGMRTVSSPFGLNQSSGSSDADRSPSRTGEEGQRN